MFGDTSREKRENSERFQADDASSQVQGEGIQGSFPRVAFCRDMNCRLPDIGPRVWPYSLFGV